MLIICNFKIKNSIFNVSRKLILHEDTSFLDLHLLMSELFSFAGYHPFIFRYDEGENQHNITIDAANIEVPITKIVYENALNSKLLSHFTMTYVYGTQHPDDEHETEAIFWQIGLDLEFKSETEQYPQETTPFCIEAEGISPSEQMTHVKVYDELRKAYEDESITEKQKDEITKQFMTENKYFCVNDRQYLDTSCFDIADLNKSLYLFFSKRTKQFFSETPEKQDVFADFTEEQAAFMKLYVQTLESIFLTLAHTGYDEATIFAMIQGELALDDHIYKMIEDDLDILQSLPTWDSMFAKDDEERLKELENELLKQWEEKDDIDVRDVSSQFMS